MQVVPHVSKSITQIELYISIHQTFGA